MVRVDLVIFKCNQQSFLSHSYQEQGLIKLKKTLIIISTAMKTLLQQEMKKQRKNIQK